MDIADMTDIELNGAAHAIPVGSTIAQLIQALSLEGKMLAVAVNRQVVAVQRWPGHVLQPQDRVDVVRAIGGG